MRTAKAFIAHMNESRGLAEVSYPPT